MLALPQVFVSWGSTSSILRKDIKMVYSDHKPIMIKTDLIMKQIKTEENNRRRVMTEEGREKYKKELEEREISRVWDNVEDLQETYKKWCAEVEEVKTKHEVIRKTTTKRRSKTMRLLIQEKKRVKDQMKIISARGGTKLTG